MIRVVGLAPIKRDATFIGGGLMVASGVMLQLASHTRSEPFGWTATAALVVGVAIMAGGSALARTPRPAHRSPDRFATVTVGGLGLAILIIGVVLAIASPIHGIGVVLIAAAAILVTLCDNVTRTIDH